jgi:hypothetical protein
MVADPMTDAEKLQRVRGVVSAWDAFIKEAETRHTNYAPGVLGMMKAARNDINVALRDD